jgi:signal transduction histidine kinase
VSVSRRQNLAHFSVSDQGPGIDLDLQDHIFEKYYQVKNSPKATNGIGYGLGLAISKQIITRHGGEIGVDSTLAKGSEFWFDIPLDNADDDD